MKSFLVIRTFLDFVQKFEMSESMNINLHNQ